MEIFRILQRRSKFFYFFLLLLGLSNAAWNNSLLFLVNSRISKAPFPFFGDHPVFIFVALIVISFIVSKTFQVFMLRLSLDLSYEMNVSIFRKVGYASYDKFVKYGKEKVYSLLQDTQTVSEFPHVFIEAFNSLIVFVVGLVYLFSISWQGASIVTVLIFFLGVIYFLRVQATQKYVETTRELSDAYNQSIMDLLNGYKEVKMSSVRSENLYKCLDRNRSAVKSLNMTTSIKWLNNDLMARYFWFIVIGVIILGLPRIMKFDDKLVSAFIVTLIFLMGPIGSLIGIIPFYSRIKVAIDKLRQFEQEVDLSEMERVGQQSDRNILDKTVERITMKNIHYRYEGDKGDAAFVLAVENLVLRNNEIVFITGGNGSGKTTFINLLIGLYAPHSGELYLNDRLIEQEDYIQYRDMMCVIFADNHMFSENYENFNITPQNSDLMEYIAYMQLVEKVVFDTKRNRLDIALSKGQQKRVSMIYALMENKGVLILDEWAADQDPEFRQYFYTEFLPELKRRGKTVIVITHDDRYFKHADRLIKFEYGRIVQDKLLLRDIQPSLV